jgi:hypothetical protein
MPAFAGMTTFDEVGNFGIAIFLQSVIASHEFPLVLLNGVRILTK